MKCIPKIIKKKFDELRVGDNIIFESKDYFDGVKGFVIHPVAELRYTSLHHHKFALINNEKFYSHDKTEFNVLILQKESDVKRLKKLVKKK